MAKRRTATRKQAPLRLNLLGAERAQLKQLQEPVTLPTAPPYTRYRRARSAARTPTEKKELSRIYKAEKEREAKARAYETLKGKYEREREIEQLKVKIKEKQKQEVKEYVKKFGERVGKKLAAYGRKKTISKPLLKKSKTSLTLKEHKPAPYISRYFKEEFEEDKRQLFFE